MSVPAVPADPLLENPPVNSKEWLGIVLKDACGLSSLYEHQLKHGLDLSLGKDVFLVIATGRGKSIVLFAPLIAAKARGERGMAFIIVPTKVLAEQMAEIGRKYGIHTLAINEDSVREAQIRDKRDLFAEFAGGTGISAAVMSPQMLQGSRVAALLKDMKIKRIVRWVLIDEVHLFRESGGTFREPYRAILPFRSRLPSSAVFGAVTGTATPSHALEIAEGLGFRGGYVNARYSIDRPNVKYIPRFFEHATSGTEFLDLSFVIPFDMKSPQEIPLTLIFAKTIQTGYRIMTFLDSLIPATIPGRETVIKLYNALMPVHYRRQFIHDMNEGSHLRIGIVTDTCTYGTDIPRLSRVIIAHISDGMEDSFEVQKQQMGRPGRNGKAAVAIVYAPAWVRDVPESDVITKQGKIDAQRRAKLPWVIRAFFNPTSELCSRGADLKYNGEIYTERPNCCRFHCPQPEESDDSNMVARWVKHFEELETVRVKSKSIRSDGTYPVLDGPLKQSLEKVLTGWRGRVYVQLRDNNDPDCFTEDVLPTHLLQRLVDRAHACSTLDRLWAVMHDWARQEELGDKLFKFMVQILPEYKAIIEECTTETQVGVPVPVAAEKDIKPVAVPPAQSSSQSLRIVIPRSTPSTIPQKRNALSDAVKKPTKKRKASNKENQPV
ncbi:unnamed protein product [Mycena citricolor]|uniref:DNA 3'-5' helicase n=1 Tax=Mycena citricolor TaxID=2018698 RepID=A0AAD2HAF8_9AGAR|nr:unnamed protein product [Mycena citricolor]